MEQGMVQTSFPGAAAAALYILFGLTVLSVVIYLQKRGGGENHAGS